MLVRVLSKEAEAWYYPERTQMHVLDQGALQQLPVLDWLNVGPSNLILAEKGFGEIIAEVYSEQKKFYIIWISKLYNK